MVLVLMHAVNQSYCAAQGTDRCSVLLENVLYRFPRFITIRSDRRPEDASTPEVIVDLYNKQSRRMTSAAEMLASKSKTKAVVVDMTNGASDQEDDGCLCGDAVDT